MESKKVILNDSGVDKTFTLQPLSARHALFLVRELLPLLADTKLIKGVIMQQFIHNMLQTGVTVEGFNREEYEAFLKLDEAQIGASMITSIMTTLDDEKLDILLSKCLKSVIYHNGKSLMEGFDAYNADMITDFTLIIALVAEVFKLNFTGAITRLKKHIGLEGASAKIQTI